MTSSAGYHPDAVRFGSVAAVTDAAVLDRLGAAKFVRLTTYRRDGSPVPTPVWVVREGEMLLVYTAVSTGKVKRLMHSPRVSLVPCDARGRVPDGAAEVEGAARVEGQQVAVERLRGQLRRKYGLLGRVLLLAERVRGRSADAVRIEIALT